MAPRKASIKRNTKETSVSVSVNLDGLGKTSIKTGINFLDHLIVSFGTTLCVKFLRQGKFWKCIGRGVLFSMASKIFSSIRDPCNSDMFLETLNGVATVRGGHPGTQIMCQKCTESELPIFFVRQREKIVARNFARLWQGNFKLTTWRGIKKPVI